jgi:hypothetical protein
MITLGADTVSKAFGAAAATIDAKVDRQLKQWGYLLETKIKGKASGRPGPNAPTGDYRRSWTTELGTNLGDRAVIVGTNKPQGRRLEYGFVGVDSLGRHFNQPPYPHVRPAMQEIEGPFLKSLAEIASAV